MSLSRELKSSWLMFKKGGIAAVLTVLALSLAVSTLIALSAQVDGITTTASKNLGKLGPDTIILTTQGRTTITDTDLAKLETAQAITNTVPVLTTSFRMSKPERSVLIVGISPYDLQTIFKDLELSQGQAYPPTASPNAVIGQMIASNESGTPIYQVGDLLSGLLSQKPCRLVVTGILKTYGQTPLTDPDNAIFVPLNYLQDLLNTKGYNAAIITIKDQSQVAQVSEFIGYVLGTRVSQAIVKDEAERLYDAQTQLRFLTLAFSGIAFTAAGFGNLFTLTRVLDPILAAEGSLQLGGRNRVRAQTILSQGLITALLGISLGAALGSILASGLAPLLLETSTWLLPGTHLSSMALRDYQPVLTLQSLGLAMITALTAVMLSIAHPIWRVLRAN